MQSGVQWVQASRSRKYKLLPEGCWTVKQMSLRTANTWSNRKVKIKTCGEIQTSRFILNIYFRAKTELLFFQLAASARNGSCVGGNKSRTPGGFITQTLPGLFFSSRRCRNIHYMHEEFSLAARIDPASPVPQQVLITLTVFSFKVCNEVHTVLSFLPDAGLYDVKGQIQYGWSFCSFPALQLHHVFVFAIVSSLLLNKHVMSLLSHPLYHLLFTQWKRSFLVRADLTSKHFLLCVDDWINEDEFELREKVSVIYTFLGFISPEWMTSVAVVCTNNHQEASVRYRVPVRAKAPPHLGDV